MSDEKKDADGKLDKILSHLDSQAKRLDAMESNYSDGMKKLDSACSKMDAAEEEKKKADAAKADAEEEKKKADAAKADADKEEAEKKAKCDAEDKAKADAAAADAAKKADASESTKELHAKIEALSRLMPAQVTAEVRTRMVGFQSKAEKVAQAFGDSAGAPPFVNGESEADYRIRLLSKYKNFSKSYKDADLTKVGDASVFGAIEDSIYADAMSEAARPSTVQRGVMIPVRNKDAAGREITRYVGHADSCWDQFNPPVRYLRRILTPGSSRLQ
jgi:chemotaxis protein histidine kinase CheA